MVWSGDRHRLKVDNSSFLRFLKADSLEFMGIDNKVFLASQTRTWGTSPNRVATKTASVQRTGLEKVLPHSGKNLG